MSDWTDVKEAIDKHTRAYNDFTVAREDNQAGSKALERAYQAWVAAHAERYEALLKHWTEEDGYVLGDTTVEHKSAGAVLRRYYAEANYASGNTKRGKKA